MNEPTGPAGPDDRELERYLTGGSALSRRYREAGGETTPPELDEAVLARARAELRRRPPGVGRWLAPVALAASLVLAVNLAWNVHQAEPLPPEARQPLRDRASPPVVDGRVASPAPAPSAPGAAGAPADRSAPRPQSVDEAGPTAFPAAPAAKAAPQRVPDRAGEAEPGIMAGRPEPRASTPQPALRQAAERQQLQEQQQDEARLRRKEAAASAERRDAFAAAAAAAPPAAPRTADTPAPTEQQKIDRLIAYVEALPDAVFIRNGESHAPAEAARHLRLKREKAGDRVRTAEDFIRLCASHSSLSGEAYLIRFADGRTRTAEDVLREFLYQMQAAP